MSKNLEDQHGSGTADVDAWTIDVSALTDNVGASTTVDASRPAPNDLGNPVMGVPEGFPVDIEARIDAVHEGVLFFGEISTEVHGECSRCLAEIKEDRNLSVHELFSKEPDPLVEEEEEQRVIAADDTIDIAPTVREALVSSIPFQPLCTPDCPGLCDQCGIRWADAPKDHHHEQLDPRWAALAHLSSSKE